MDDKQKSGIIFLTSTGFSNPDVYAKFLGLASNPKEKRVAIVTTAAEGKENNKFSQLALSQLSAMGFTKIDFCDLEDNPDQYFSEYDIIYVCGGNTFKLLKYANIANFKKSVISLLGRGGIYVGVSAGSIILGSSIKIAGEIAPDINEVKITDLTGFSLIDFVLLPHYSPELEQEISNFEKKEEIKVTRISNEQAVIVINGSIIKI